MIKEHLIDIDSNAKKDKSRELLENCCSGTKGTLSKSLYDVHRDIVLWFCEDVEPFSTVENSGCRNFFQKNCGIDLPDRSTLAKTPFVDMYKTQRQFVIEDLETVSSATLMYDGWTDEYQKIPFLGIRLT